PSPSLLSSSGSASAPLPPNATSKISQSNRSLSNSTINFDLRLVNPNLNKGTYYDPVNVSFFHVSNRSDSLGNYTIPGFFHGHQKKATKGWTIDNVMNVSRCDAFNQITNKARKARVDRIPRVFYDRLLK
ncbi:Protein NDR1, partial [Linum perenne]